MADFVKKVQAEPDASPELRARMLVDKQAKELSRFYNEIEEEISTVGARLDRLKSARQILGDALRATEKIRSESDLPEPSELKESPSW